MKENSDIYSNNDVLVVDINRPSAGNNITTRNKKYKSKKSKFNIEEKKDTEENLRSKEKESKKKKNEKDNYAEDNFHVKDIINNALFTQLSEIRVNLINFDEKLNKMIYNTNGAQLPKIDYCEFTLLNPGINISQFKKYGFGIYVFFLYLINLIVTFTLLFIFGFHYIYSIFFKYYQDFEAECDIFFECDILSLGSGVQIKKFRRYYIETFGKKAFLDKYKNFDVIYKEYIVSGTLIFVLIFIIDFLYMIYLQRVYKSYRDENPEINNYSLILSGQKLPFLDTKEIDLDNESLMNKKKEEIRSEIKNILKIEPGEINFTLKLSDYYEKLDDLIEKMQKRHEYEHYLNDKTKYRWECCFCFCICFCCCCSKEKYKGEKTEIIKEINDLSKELDNIKENDQYNPLYIITFKNKEDYENAFSKYPHSYIMKSIKSICGKENGNIYINKAPSPEDIAWQNLEFDKEHDYFKNKFKILGISLVYLAVSFVMQLIAEFIGYIPGFDSSKFMQFVINIGISYIMEKVDDKFSEFINKNLENYVTSWSISDIEYYSILFKSIFKFINNGIFPLLIYFITDAIFGEGDDDYANLVTKLFVIIEMDGFGYPMFDLFHIVLNKKGKEMYEYTEKMMTSENIDKEFREQQDNKEGSSRFKLEQTFEKPDMEIGDKYCDILNIYWITMFYLSIYPIGIFQSFLNLLFKFIIEKNFLINIYKRPSYINPHFGFLCFNFFNFGFLIFMWRYYFL